MPSNMRCQMRELLAQYHPDVLVCDYSYPICTTTVCPQRSQRLESEKLLALIRELCQTLF